MFVRHSDLTICIRLNFRLQKLNIELKSLRGVATGIAPSMAPNVYVQLNAAVDQALPYEGMTAEVEYVKCRDHLPRRRKESVVTAAQPKRRVTPQPSQATSKGANPEARKQWREAIAQAIVGLIINLDAVKVRNMYIYIYICQGWLTGAKKCRQKVGRKHILDIERNSVNFLSIFGGLKWTYHGQVLLLSVFWIFL